jgi:hypothetical protein
MHTHQQRLFLNTIILLLLSGMACNLLSRVNTPNPAPPTSTGLPATPQTPATEPARPATQVSTRPTPPPGVYGRSFAAYPVLEVKLPPSFQSGYTLPVELSSVQGMDLLKLSAAQKDLLSSSGFVVAAPAPGEYHEFYQVYESQRYTIDQPLFVTTDSVFHVYHLIFDKMLRDLETARLLPALEDLTRAMLGTAKVQYQALKDTSLEEPARRNLAYFSVAAALLKLDEPVPDEVKDLVSAEMDLIDAHAGASISPIWDRSNLPDDKKLIEDYSQYIPRGHYTRSEDFKRYFRAMMWYGRMTLRLRDTFETRRALLMIQAIRSTFGSEGSPAEQLWANIYDPTTFIVGKADDLSFQEYGALSDAVYGSGPDLHAFADDALLETFIQGARQLPAPQVNSMWVWIWEDRGEATQGFRFMGQRFTLDAYVFGQLMWRKVGTVDKPRDLPKGLDFLAAMGSQEALNILNNMGEANYEHYTEQMDKVRQEVASLETDTWTQNLYWSWLYAFQPVIQPKDARFPAFMQTNAWTRKDLHTALGSWTELKHDTILYAKQVMAEMGGGAPENPPHGYVEPNPEAYARLWALARMTYDGLSERQLLTDLTRGNLENLMDLLTFLKGTSESELAGKGLSDDDYWRIQYFGGELEALTLAASDCDTQSGDCRDLSDRKAALVADVATGMGRVLEEGVGQPAVVYVIAPDQPWRVAVGAVFTYYEFELPPDQRMTDEQWQAQVESGQTPPPPDWVWVFMAP